MPQVFRVFLFCIEGTNLYKTTKKMQQNELIEYSQLKVIILRIHKHIWNTHGF